MQKHALQEMTQNGRKYFPLRYPLALVLTSASLGLPEYLARMCLSNLANTPPTTIAQRLYNSMDNDTLPDDADAMAAFIFDQCTGHDDQLMLLDLYEGLKLMDVAAHTLESWRW